ncbi:MAG: endonuclease/exonuclease/phosphatase family protein [Oligoflexia bacterium]|nr:endonuclease/exonuclease/phosphatase family protein [Oligoflexia bacterium]
MRSLLRKMHPDLVFLQEVLGQHEGHRQKILEWPVQSQFEFLADEIWPHYAYGKNAVYSAGHHGNAILSKFPIVSWENIDISTNRVERRGLLHGVIRIPGHSRPIHAINVHLGLLEAERSKQLRQICDRIDSHVPHGDPLVLAGDFNDWRIRASDILERKLEVREAFFTLTGNHARTFPSWLPALRLDRIYFRGLTAHSAECLAGKPWSELSDHIALYVEMAV